MFRALLLRHHAVYELLIYKTVATQYFDLYIYMPVPVVARSKVWIYGRSPVEIVGSNPTGGMYVCLSCECCQVEVSRRVDHSSRGVLPTVMRRCVWSRNLKNEEVVAHWGGCRAKETNKRNLSVRTDDL